MCGIVGYIGDKSAVSVLMVGLTKLEYRGYDSAGVAVIHDGQVQVRKRVGKLQVLAESLKEEPIDGHIGIGHCLAPGTLIQLADGQVLPIEQVEGNVAVLSLDPATLRFVSRPATVFHHRAPEQLLEIRTSATGLTCTPEHRMLIVDITRGDLRECRARDIRPGHLLLFARRIPAPHAPRPLTFASVRPRRYWSLSEKAAATLRSAAASV
ncbi:MAG: hypothetical protein RMK49_20235, partial [Abditibacteriales bacterium]|nr:hypothetical protein [Abditibacteriales bacterium]